MSKKCFEKCITRPGPKLDSKQQGCLANCMDRYMYVYARKQGFFSICDFCRDAFKTVSGAMMSHSQRGVSGIIFEYGICNVDV